MTTTSGKLDKQYWTLLKTTTKTGSPLWTETVDQQSADQAKLLNKSLVEFVTVLHFQSFKTLANVDEKIIFALILPIFFFPCCPGSTHPLVRGLHVSGLRPVFTGVRFYFMCSDNCRCAQSLTGVTQVSLEVLNCDQWHNFTGLWKKCLPLINQSSPPHPHWRNSLWIL